MTPFLFNRPNSKESKYSSNRSGAVTHDNFLNKPIKCYFLHKLQQSIFAEYLKYCQECNISI